MKSLQCSKILKFWGSFKAAAVGCLICHFLLACLVTYAHTHTCTHAHAHTFYGPLDFLQDYPRWAGTRKVKPIWILLKQETVSGIGISWAICKSVPRSWQITTPAPRPLSLSQTGCPSCHATKIVKARKATHAELLFTYIFVEHKFVDATLLVLLLLLHLFNSLFLKTTWVSRRQKSRTILVKPIWIYWSKR